MKRRRRDLQNMQVKKNSVGQMKQKTYFSTIAFLIFFPPTEFFSNLVYIRIRLILVVTKTLIKIHRPKAEILAHEVGKYEKVTVD